MQVKLHGLPNTKGHQSHKLTISTTLDRTLTLEQLTDVGNFVNESLRLLGSEDNTSCLGVDAMEKLCELQGNIKAARAALKGAGVHRLFPYHAVDPRVFSLLSGLGVGDLIVIDLRPSASSTSCFRSICI